MSCFRDWSPWHAVAAALLLASLTASATETPVAPPSEHAGSCRDGTLCARLGGPPVLAAIASDLIDRTSVDPRTREHWERVDLKRVKQMLGLYLCVLAGGDCNYVNDDMRAIHAGQHIRSGEFYALVENLRTVLDERGVAAREKNELLALLAPSKRDVVDP